MATSRSIPYSWRAGRWAGGVILAALLMVGCRSRQRPVDIVPEDSSANAEAETITETAVTNPMMDAAVRPAGTSTGQPPPEPKVLTLQVEFSVLRARVPEGVFSRSPRIWNHLDGEVIPAETARLLALNGFRTARGRVDAWMPIKALLDSEKDVTSTQSKLRASNGFPLILELDSEPRDRTFFLFRPSGHLAGADYPQSVSSFRVEYTVPPTAPSELVVEVMPEIRLTETRRPPPMTVDEFLGPRTEQISRVIRELTFKMQLAPEEFFVIGPSESVHSGHRIGALMLCEEQEGRRYESMYFVTPRVVSTGRVLLP